MPPGRAKANGAPCKLLLHLEITLPPKTWTPLPRMDVWEGSAGGLCLVLFNCGVLFACFLCSFFLTGAKMQAE